MRDINDELRGARDGLELRVEERTKELVATQHELINAARAAGMAEIATGVLHNIGNALNSGARAKANAQASASQAQANARAIQHRNLDAVRDRIAAIRNSR